MERKSLLVYAGKGSSHSWTWLADLFEAHGICDVRFADTRGFTEDLNDAVGTVLLSGGDGFAIASAIGPHGFSHLKGFIHRGGAYVGICAGAYLPLPSSLEPFKDFNISTTKIENIDLDKSGEESSPRVAVRYGTCRVVHPVRGEIELECDGEVIKAPLYGGPVFSEPTADEVLARYRGLTERTEFQLEKSRAASLLAGKPAVIRSHHGYGRILLFGPHFEHPDYSAANARFLNMIEVKAQSTNRSGAPSSVMERNRFMERALGDLKVAILGLENRSFLVGNKLWDGSRFLELVDAIERRFHTLDEKQADELTTTLIRTRAEILKAKPESLLFADEGPERLVEAARIVVDNHFAVMRKDR